MKSLLLVATLTLSFYAAAAPAKTAKTKSMSQKICDAMQTKIEDDCAHIMCDDAIADGSVKDLDECTSGEDYAEAAQGACDGQPTLEDLVLGYNKAHPKSKIKCD